MGKRKRGAGVEVELERIAVAVVKAANGCNVEQLSLPIDLTMPLEQLQNNWVDVISQRIANDIAWRLEEHHDGLILIESNFLASPIRWSVHPLPLHHVAILRSDLPTRRSASAHPLPVSLAEWRSNWLSLSFWHLTPKDIGAISRQRDPVLKIGDTVHESPTVELKFPTSTNTLNDDLFADQIKPLQFRSLLSASGRKEFLVGVDDSGSVIGMELCCHHFRPPKIFQVAFSKECSALFPPPNLSLFASVSKLDLPSSFGPNATLVPVGPIKRDQDIPCILRFYQGAAVVEKLEDGILVYVSESDALRVPELQSKYTQLRSLDLLAQSTATISAEEWQDSGRSVVSLEFEEADGHSKIYAFDQDYPGVGSPLSVWLRWHQKNRDDVAHLLQIYGPRKVLLDVSDDNFNAPSVEHTLGVPLPDLELCRPEEFTSFHSPYRDVRNILFLPLVVATEQLSLEGSHVIIVLMLREHLEDSQSLRRLRKLIELENIEVVIIDPSRLATPLVLPYMPIHSISIGEEKVKEEYRTWMITRSQPTWEVAGALFHTPIMISAVKRIIRTHSSSCPVVHIPFRKTMGGCGATATIMGVAHLLTREKNCLSSVRPYRAFAWQKGLDISSFRPPDADLLCTPIFMIDDTNLPLVQKIITCAKQHWRSFIVLSVHDESEAKIIPQKQQMVVSPYLDANRARAFGHHLKAYFPEFSKAIDMVVDRATSKKPGINSHLYLFCVAATRGESKPPREWIADIKERLGIIP